MAVADNFRNSDYLLRYYIESAQALWAFEHDNNIDDFGIVYTLNVPNPIATTPVPLPATVWLLLSGFGALGLLFCRRSHYCPAQG